MSAATAQMTDATAAAELRRAAKLKQAAEDLQWEAMGIVQRVARGSARADEVFSYILLSGRPERASAFGLQVCADELDTPELKRRRSA